MPLAERLLENLNRRSIDALAPSGCAQGSMVFAATVTQYIGYVNQDGAMSVQQLFANFGVYGELPLVAVRLSDCHPPLDAHTGECRGRSRGGRYLLDA